jgi:hypothetical protein
MRRTGATMMEQVGVKSTVIDLCQNHAIRTRVQKSYQHHDYKEEMKDAWALLGMRLDQLMLDADKSRRTVGKAGLPSHLIRLADERGPGYRAGNADLLRFVSKFGVQPLEDLLQSMKARKSA